MKIWLVHRFLILHIIIIWRTRSTDSTGGQQEDGVFQTGRGCKLDISNFIILVEDDGDASRFKEVDKTKYLSNEADNVYRYRFNDGLKCIKLNYGDQIIWIHDVDQYGYHYPTEFVLSQEEITVEIRNLSLTYVCYQGKWALFTTVTHKSDFKDFTVVTSDDADVPKLRFNDSSQYDLLSYPDGMKMFLFKDNSRCVEFRFRETSVWKLELHKHNAKFPTSIVYKPDGLVFVNFDPYYLVYEFDVQSSRWTLNNSKSYRVPGIVDPSDHPQYLTVVTSDNEDGSDLKLNDTSHYKLYSYFDNLYLYWFESNARCYEFRFRETSVWKYDNTKDPRFPRSISVDLVDSVIDIEFDGQTLRFRLSGSRFISYTVKDDLGSQTPVSKHFAEQTSDQVAETQSRQTQDPRDLTTEGLSDDKHKPTTRSLRTSEPKAPDSVSKPAKEPSKPKTSSQPSVSQPIKPAVEAVSEQTKPKEPDSSTSTVSVPPKTTQASVPVTPSTMSSSVDVASEPKAPVQDSPVSQPAELSSKVSTQAPGSEPNAQPASESSNSSRKHDPSVTNSSLSKFKVITDGSKQPNDITKYNLKVTPDMITYKFNSDTRCTELKFEDKSVWTHDQSKHKSNHPTYIFVHINSKIIYLKIGDSLFACSLEGQNWSGSVVKPIQLDISKKESTSEYECITSDNIGTYTAKDNVVFQEVIRKKPKCRCGSDFTFYQTKDYSQYVYKVVRDGTNLTKSITNVTLYLVNGRVLTLTKDNDYSYNLKSWTPLGPPELTIITGGSRELTDSSKYDIFNDHDIFDYIFGDNTKCTQIILKDESLWNHEDLKPFPKSLIYYRSEARLLLSFHDENIVFKKQDDEWYKTTYILSEIDIKSRESTSIYKYTRNGNSSVGSLEAKEGFGFSKVIQKKNRCNCFGSDKLVWEAEGISEHAVKLLIDGLGTMESTKEVQVYLANGDLLKYTKTGGCCNKQWTLLSTHLHAAPSKESSSRVVDSSSVSQPTSSTSSPVSIPKSTTPSIAVPKISSSAPGSEPKASEASEESKGTTGKGHSSEPSISSQSKGPPETSPASTPTGRSVSQPSTQLKIEDGTTKSVEIKTQPDSQSSSPKTEKSTSQPTGSSGTSSNQSSSGTNISDSGFKIFTLDPSDSSKTKENDSSQYDLKDMDCMLKFEFKEGTKCVELKHENDSIWKYDQSKHEGKHPKSLYIFKNGLMVLFDMSDGKFLLLGSNSDKKWESESLTGVRDLSESSIKIITKDGTNNTKENDKSKYCFTRLDFALEYKFKDDAECTEVKHDDESVWKYDSQNNTDYPSFIYIMSGNNVLVFLI